MPSPSFTKFWNLAPDVSNPNILNMYVYGEIKTSSNWFWGSDTDVVTSSFIKDLNKYPNVDTINVYINSPGGDVYAAAAIRNQLRTHKATVHTWGDGMIASAAVGILQAADSGCRHMSRAALLMVHDPATRVSGTAKDMEQAAILLNKVKETILSIYLDSTTATKEELADMMDKTTYLTADEAKQFGFIDLVTEDEATMSIENNDTFVFNGVPCIFSNFADPEQLRQKLTEIEPYIKNVNEGGTVMTFEEILNALPAEQQAVITTHITDSISAAVEDKQTLWDREKETMQNDLTAAQTRVVTLENQIKGTAGDDPEEAILNSLSEDARKLVVEARAAAAAAEATLQNERQAAAKAAFKQSMQAYEALPITDEQMDALFTLSTSDSTNFASLSELLTIANNAISAGFVSVGTDKGKPLATDAYTELENKVAEKRAADPTISYNDAMRIVVNENPDLYDRYRDSKIV